MQFRLAINGYGRIGRCILRALYESSYQDKLKIVAINELADIETIAHLTKYDSTHGRFQGTVRFENDTLFVNDDAIHVSSREEIYGLPWANHGVDVVLECTGAFTERQKAEQHIKCGAKKVIFSQPAEKNVDATVIYGVNDDVLSKDDRVISNASCTTNCIIPVLKTIDDELGIDYGMITTIHSMMNDQPVIDAYHHHDLRRTRCSGNSIIPVNTELAKGIGRIMPHLFGRFEALAMRVPVINVSAMDLTVTVNKDTTADGINSILKTAARGRLENIMGYTEDPLASCDFNHDPRSCVVDLNQTRVSGTRVVKILAWFDNEWGYANRMLDTTLALMNA
ncbi:type I glyceraldehyde-3-phosphate dehydrogenase [bacterium]|nr:type I glyceraldehyde-3-phosphate dehydrogenase [bacterium]